MKILLFIENEQQGGLDTFCKNLIDYWPDKNDTFVIVCNRCHQGIEYLKKIERAKVYEHDIFLNWMLIKKLDYFPAILKRLISKLIRFFLITSQRTKIIKIFNNVNCDTLITINGGYPGGETCRQANICWDKIYNKKSIHSVHGFAFKPKKIIRNFEARITKRLIRSRVKFVAVSEYVKSSLINYPGFESKVTCIHNGTPINNSSKQTDSNIKEELMIDDNCIILLMLGAYNINKGHEFLFRCMQLVHNTHPHCHLITCGSDKVGMENIQIIKKRIYNSNKIHLLPFRENIHSLIKYSDILLAAPQHEEAFGLTLIEAMAESKPIIATDVGGIKEIFGSNYPEIGKIVPKDNIEMFANNIKYLLDNQTIRKNMGECGKSRALRYFSAENMARKYHEILKQ